MQDKKNQPFEGPAGQLGHAVPGRGLSEMRYHEKPYSTIEMRYQDEDLKMHHEEQPKEPGTKTGEALDEPNGDDNELGMDDGPGEPYNETERDDEPYNETERDDEPYNETERDGKTYELDKPNGEGQRRPYGVQTTSRCPPPRPAMTYPLRERVRTRRYPPPPPPRNYQPVFWPMVLFIIVLALAVGLVLTTEFQNTKAQVRGASELEIEPGMVFFELKEVEGESYRLEVSMFITNYGEKVSGDITLRGYAENKANDIVYDHAETTMEPIPARLTREVTLPIELPANESYRIRIFLFEHDMITISGYGEVSLSSVGQTVLEFTSEQNEVKEPSSKGGYGDDDSPGLSGALALGTLVMVGYLYRRNRRDIP